MSGKAKVGIANDYFDKDGKLVFPGDLLGIFKDIPQAEYKIIPEFTAEVTPRQISGFDMVISRSTCRWTHGSLIGNNQLLGILRTGVGYDNIDVSALNNANVILTVTPNAVRRPMATAVITFVLALSTKLIPKDKLTREGRWGDRTRYQGTGLTGKVLGSIGVGNIGHEVFTLAKPWGMKHIAYDPYLHQNALTDVDVKLVDLNTVLAESDFLNISCPLTKESYHLIGEKELRKMKKTAFLINTARGPIVDERALTRALQERWIQGAGVDVFEQEPVSVDNPLLKLENIIVNPHYLGINDEMFTLMWQQIKQQIIQILSGKTPEGLVNGEIWDKPPFQDKLGKLLKSLS